MKKTSTIALAVTMLFAAVNLSTTPANAGFFEDVVKGITGLSGTDLGSGR